MEATKERIAMSDMTDADLKNKIRRNLFHAKGAKLHTDMLCIKKKKMEEWADKQMAILEERRQYILRQRLEQSDSISLEIEKKKHAISNHTEIASSYIDELERRGWTKNEIEELLENIAHESDNI